MAASPWQNPPQKVLAPVYFRLFPIHRLAFSLTCRSWNAYASSQPQPSFPLILPHLYWVRNCRLRSPFHHNVYLPYQPPEAELIRCRGSVGSWLLYHTFKEGERPFFVDPAFNNERVHLPPWRWEWILPFDAIISAAPTDRGCTVVFLDEKMIIHCKVGDEMWSSCEIDTSLSRSTGAFLSGTLHVMDEHQRLGVVDFGNVRNPVTWLAMDVGPLRGKLGMSIEYGRHFLMESSGTLLLAFVGQPQRWYVFWADLTAMVWRGVEDLQDRSLFLSPSRSVSAVATEAGVEGNRLYFARGETSQASLQRWISVATHRQGNCWEETSFSGRYSIHVTSPFNATRWVFQPVVVIDSNAHA